MTKSKKSRKKATKKARRMEPAGRPLVFSESPMKPMRQLLPIKGFIESVLTKFGSSGHYPPDEDSRQGNIRRNRGGGATSRAEAETAKEMERLADVVQRIAEGIRKVSAANEAVARQLEMLRREIVFAREERANGE